MTFTLGQIEAVERQRKAEYDKDMEALARVKNMLVHADVKPENILIEEDSSDVNDETPTIIGKVDAVFAADPERKWTVPAMVNHLRHEKFPLAATKPEATVGLIFAKLRKRGKIRIVKRGSGRTPNIFRAVPQGGDSDVTSNSERPTNGQAVAVH